MGVCMRVAGGVLIAIIASVVLSGVAQAVDVAVCNQGGCGVSSVPVSCSGGVCSGTWVDEVGFGLSGVSEWTEYRGYGPPVGADTFRVECLGAFIAQGSAPGNDVDAYAEGGLVRDAAFVGLSSVGMSLVASDASSLSFAGLATGLASSSRMFLHWGQLTWLELSGMYFGSCRSSFTFPSGVVPSGARVGDVIGDASLVDLGEGFAYSGTTLIGLSEVGPASADGITSYVFDSGLPLFMPPLKIIATVLIALGVLVLLRWIWAAIPFT